MGVLRVLDSYDEPIKRTLTYVGGMCLPWGQISPRNLPEKDLLEKAPHVFEQSITSVKPMDKLRLQHLSNLSTEKVWVPQVQQSPSDQTVIIFDWDDTLLCTSYLGSLKDGATSPQVRADLQRIELLACKLLNTARQLGHTFIITNAVDGWVEKSAAEYLPGLMPALSKVRIISARSTQESQCSGDIKEWKVRAFLEVGRQFDTEITTNLVSVGDSTFELDAANVLSREFSLGLLKTVKLQPCPSSQELLKELEVLETKLGPIVQKACNLNIRLGKTFRKSR